MTIAAPLTNIFVAGANKNAFVYAEYVTSRETIAPTSACQIAQHHVLTVGLVFVGLSAIAGIKANLQ